MKLKALVTAEIIRSEIEVFCENIDFVYAGYTLDHNVLPHNELLELIRDIDILICEYDTINADILDNAEKLKLIVCCRGGVSTVIDLKKTNELGITVCNNIGRNARSVADVTMAFMLDMTRNISATNALIHSRTITAEVSTKPSEYKDTVWGLDNNSPFIKYRGSSLNHMTLGIVGFGHAGKLVAKRAAAFEMKICTYDPFVKDIDKYPEIDFVDFEKLLEISDVVTVHVPSAPSTKDLFSEKTFSIMKDGAYFINTSRGDVVVEDALIESLKSGKLSGAAIDVTRKEPISSDSPLLDAPNLIITPHIAGSSYDVQAEGSKMVLEELRRFLNNEAPLNEVTLRK